MNEHKKLIYEDAMGQKVKVERESIKNEGAQRANEMLGDIGDFLNPVPEGLKYMGSLATHIYVGEGTETIYFMAQTGALMETPEIVASDALKDLKGAAMVAYGRARKTLRSNF